MSMSTVVTLIVLIIGFVILVFLYRQFNFSDKVDEQLCHQSVILRASLPETLGAKSYVPLKCKTDKICITGSLIGGKCKDFNNTAGVRTVVVKDITQVEKTIVENLYKCWQTMGEGKVGLFSQYLASTYGVPFTNVYPSCVVCDRIDFDYESLQKKGIDLTKMDLKTYMDTRAVPETDMSYSAYFNSEAGKYKIEEDLFSVNTPTNQKIDVDLAETIKESIDQEKQRIQNIEKSSGQLAVVFMQISAPGHWDSVKNIGSFVLGSTISSAAVAPGATFGIAKSGGKFVANACKSGWGAVVCGAIAIVVVGGQQISVGNKRAVAAAHCGDVSVGDEARSGCSVVRVVNYDVADLQKFCTTFENIA